jgi:hypothetical protein
VPDAGTYDAGPFDAGPFEPNAAFAALGDNGTLDLGPNNFPPPAGEENANGVTDYSGLVYDSSANELLLFGGGHATTQTSGLYRFSLSTLTWTSAYALTATQDMTCANFNAVNGTWLMPVEQPLSRHTYDTLEAPPAVGNRGRQFWMFRHGDAVNGQAAANLSSTCLAHPDPNIYWGNDNRASVYNFGQATWTFPPALFGGGFGDTAVEYDPVADDIVGLGSNGFFVTSLETQVTTLVSNSSWPDLGYANHLTYSSGDDAFYYFNRNDQTVWRLVRNRSTGTHALEMVAYSGPYPAHGEPGFDDDFRHGVLVGGVSQHTVSVFHPDTATFTSEPAPNLPDQRFHAIAYVPVDNVFLFVGEDGHTWAYRYRM